MVKAVVKTRVYILVAHQKSSRSKSCDPDLCVPESSKGSCLGSRNPRGTSGEGRHPQRRSGDPRGPPRLAAAPPGLAGVYPGSVLSRCLSSWSCICVSERGLWLLHEVHGAPPPGASSALNCSHLLLADPIRARALRARRLRPATVSSASSYRSRRRSHTSPLPDCLLVDPQTHGPPLRYWTGSSAAAAGKTGGSAVTGRSCTGTWTSPAPMRRASPTPRETVSMHLPRPLPEATGAVFAQA
ncbi:uncharacterized protein LOC143040845 [Oratosquilla oratoria]|uniref:uncharacterized protein LOC143040845 n=1 Tax=Oratosquilla oratoria TaxID=337810 RepID=UPI003F767468